MINVFIVEDHQIVSYAVKQILSESKIYQVIGESESAESALEKIQHLKVDVIITDIRLGGMDGIELTKTVKKLYKSAIKILAMSMYTDEVTICESLDAGANGYLTKNFLNSELFSALDTIMKGDIYASSSVSQIITNAYLEKLNIPKSNHLEITRREKQIISYISAGLNNKEIADKLMLSRSTVDSLRYNILKKLDVKNTAELIIKCIKLNVVSANNIFN